MPTKTANFTILDEAKRVLSLLDPLLLSDEQFDLVAHGYGALVALHLTKIIPGRIRRLVLFEPIAFCLLPRFHPSLSLIRSVSARVVAGVDEVRQLLFGREDASLSTPQDRLFTAKALSILSTRTQELVDYWGGKDFFSQLTAQQQYRLMRCMPKAAVDLMAAWDDRARVDDFRDLPVRTLLLMGTASPECTKLIVERLATALPWREVVSVNGGHLAPIMQPDLVNPLIQDFINEKEDGDMMLEFEAPSSRDCA